MSLQNRCIAFLDSYIRRTGGVSPCYDEIARGCGLTSKSQVNRLMQSLEHSGRIRRMPGRARAIEVVKRERYYVWDNENKELVPLKGMQS